MHKKLQYHDEPGPDFLKDLSLLEDFVNHLMTVIEAAEVG